jgi:CspA family cold shock protein
VRLNAIVVDVQSVGTVRVWHREEGWGVIDSPDTPGGCWANFPVLWDDDTRQTRPGQMAVSGFRELFNGEVVDFAWRAAKNQYGYTFAATSVYPRGRRAPNTYSD